MIRLAIFASGTGSNAQKIIQYFEESDDVEISLIVSNKANAGVLNFAEHYDIPSMIIDRQFFYHTKQIVFELNHQSIDYIILAGFLWLIPSYLVKAFANKIINIHPALLPKYGGKGMYGLHVHDAVKKAGENKSGITIHYVNESYDDGAIIFQTSCEIYPEDLPTDIQKKVQILEHKYYPEIIEKIVLGEVKKRST
ncbi:MAG: phosphoribosylglycinamide formyltransferase [Saprospiraceae bacterium]|nr:phosphoribosylglycinamide formyltransferase [Saprospiraceae bacterium]